MLELVTIEEARSHLRIDTGTPDDLWLAIFIPAISEAVANWLKDDWRLYEPELGPSGNPVIDSNGDQVPLIDSNGYTTRWSVKAAVLIELGSVYRFREGEGTDNVVPDAAGHGYVLNKVSTALLTPLRRPTVA